MWLNRRFPALPIGPDRRALGAEQVRQGEDAGRGRPQGDQPCRPSERTRTAGTGGNPRDGAGFAVLRGLGWLRAVLGSLVAMAGMIALVATVIRIGPELASALQPPMSQFAGFVAMLLAVWLLLPLAGITLGLGSVALGYAPRRVATRPADA